MRCLYFDSGVCRSCTLMGQDYSEQLALKEEKAHALLPIDDDAWLSPFTSPEQHFRNKAKLLVGGSTSNPTLGILDSEKTGVDITGCKLYEASLSRAFEPLRAFIERAKLTPFNVQNGRGELKNLIITAAPSGQLMIRFVLRSTEALVRIKKHVEWLKENIDDVAVVTVNLLPERKAVMEGTEEIFVTEQESLAMNLERVTLHLRPQSFFQTNTAVAQGLYEQASAWVKDIKPGSLWDLYCGVGGFALHCAVDRSESSKGYARTCVGVEISAQAVKSAKLSATEAGIDAHFIASDAYTAAQKLGGVPELVIVNPPRRGIGELAPWLNDSRAQYVLYSSCNPLSLAKDIAAMPDFYASRAQIFDMFPHTLHTETLVLLKRR